MTLQTNISKETKAAKTQEVYKHVLLFKMASPLSHKITITAYALYYPASPDRPLLPMLKNFAFSQTSTRTLFVQAWNRKNEYFLSPSCSSGALLAYTHLSNF